MVIRERDFSPWWRERVLVHGDERESFGPW